MLPTLLLCSTAFLGAELRQPTASEMAAARARLDKYVPAPDYEVVEAVASGDERGAAVFVKVRYEGPLGGWVLRAWKVYITQGRGGLVIEWPFPDKHEIEVGQEMIDSLLSIGSEYRVGRNRQERTRAPTRSAPATSKLAGRLPPPGDRTVRYVVVYDDDSTTVYVWTKTRWRELGQALPIRVEAVPKKATPRNDAKKEAPAGAD